MEYRVSYILGEVVREAVMNQRDLEECRARFQIVEAVAVADASAAINSQIENKAGSAA